MAGWNIKLLIADCGSQGQVDHDVSEFIKNLSKATSSSSLRNIDITLLNQLFNPSSNDSEGVISVFQNLISRLKVKELIDINQKEYSEEVKAELKEEPALKFMRPILTCAAVIYLANNVTEGIKTIVVAGADEKIQWNHVMTTSPDKFGAMFIPLLKSKPDACGSAHTAKQRKNWPCWFSKSDLTGDFITTNAGKWAFQLFAQVPSFPAENVEICGVKISESNWVDEFSFPAGLTAPDLATHIWPLLDPSAR